MNVEHLVDRDLAQPRIDRLALPGEPLDLLDRGRERVAQDLFRGHGIPEARQDHRAVQGLCVAFEDRAHGVEVALLGLLDQALLCFELGAVLIVSGFGGHQTPIQRPVRSVAYTRGGRRPSNRTSISSRPCAGAVIPARLRSLDAMISTTCDDSR